jgi:potassium-transporting ATPase KdpC subunit
LFIRLFMKFIISIRPALVLLLIGVLLFGLLYPGFITGVAEGVARSHARGSLIEKNGTHVGSERIGQHFTQAKYFHGRPSATTPPYNASASGASNLTPAGSAQRALVEERAAALRSEAGHTKALPIDMVTASGSGLDPHISVAAAELQVARVARARGVSEKEVLKRVREHTEGPQLGILGTERVHVLKLNLALDGD